MKRVITICLLMFTLAYQGGACQSESRAEQQQTGIPSATTEPDTLKPSDSRASVMICNSSSAYAYHSSKCGGLSRCKAGISTVSKKEAEERGYKPCKICY